jgi:hypothetical protein
MSNVTEGELSLSPAICEVAHSIDNYFSTTLSQEYVPYKTEMHENANHQPQSANFDMVSVLNQAS